MILNEGDIYNNIESFKNKMGYSQEKMAEMLGLSNKQAYSNMMKKRTMKLKYLVNLVNKSGLPVSYFMSDESTKEQPQVEMAAEPGGVYGRDKNCEEKDRTIEAMRKTIETQERYIAMLESQGREKGNGTSG